MALAGLFNLPLAAYLMHNSITIYLIRHLNSYPSSSRRGRLPEIELDNRNSP